MKRLYLVLIVLMLVGCGPGQPLGPTVTATPTITSTPTNTPTITPTPTLTPTATATPTPQPVMIPERLARDYMLTLSDMTTGFIQDDFPFVDTLDGLRTADGEETTLSLYFGGIEGWTYYIVSFTYNGGLFESVRVSNGFLTFASDADAQQYLDDYRSLYDYELVDVAFPSLAEQSVAYRAEFENDAGPSYVWQVAMRERNVVSRIYVNGWSIYENPPQIETWALLLEDRLHEAVTEN